MSVSTFVDIAVLQDYRKRKLLRCQQHPTRDLFVWNYTDIVQAKGAWDTITTQTRGLITDSKGNVKARSFKKFHNIEQNLHTPSAEFTVYEKLDGSLIIVFWDTDEWIVASRGSFESAQSSYASNLIKTKYDISGLDKSLAYSFEVIYPENRVVVDYMDRKELVFLAAFAKDGTEVDVRESIAPTRIPVVNQYKFDDYKTIKALNWENSEGFVVRFSNGERVKIKFEDYLNLHGKLTSLNALTIWTRFSAGTTLESVLEDIPDEYYDWVQKKWLGFAQDYEARKAALDVEFAALRDGDRKQFAIGASASPNKAALFAIYDNRPHVAEAVIMQAIKPVNGVLDVPYSGKVSTAPSKPAPPPKSGSILLMIGPSGSGKSTWASSYVNAHPSAIRVNRDSMRQQLYGYTADTMQSYYTHPSLRKREDAVTRFETSVIRDALKDGYDVVVDNTNLNSEYIQRYRKTFPYVNISYKLMDASLETCVERDRARPSPVGEETLRRQHEKFQALRKSSVLKKLDNRHMPPQLAQDSSLPKAYVFDMDGTLADCSKRNPYDWNMVDTDSVRLPVKETLHAHKAQGYTILICTGRDEICREKTAAWLAANDIPYDGLYMRPRNNSSSDWVVKESMWSEISKTHNIVALYDDRNSVVEHARRCGLTVFQVAEGDF